jgi:hypothetical protein
MPGYEVWVHRGGEVQENAPVAEDVVIDEDRMDEMFSTICPGSAGTAIILNSGRRYVILIVIDIFFLWTTPLGCKVMLSERILLWKMDL